MAEQITRKGDAESIVGEELAEKLENREQQLRSSALVTMSEGTDPEVTKMEDEEEKKKQEKEKKDEEDDMEEKSEVLPHILQSAFDSYRSAFDEICKSDLPVNEKLQAMQPVYDRMAQTTRAAIEGISVEEVKENAQITELRSMVAQLSQDVQILTQAVKDKSNVRDVQVPQPRSLQPQQVTFPTVPTAQGQPMDLHSQIRRSVGLQS